MRFLLLIASLVGLWTAPARAQSKAEAAARPPVTIPVFVSSRGDACYEPGDVAAISKLARLEAERINKAGGAGGRQIRLQFLDDERDQAKATANLRQAIADPNTIAMIGLSNTQRAKGAFDDLAKPLREAAIPFLSNIAVNSIYEPFPTVFTTQASQDDERLPAIAAFIRDAGYARVGFVGLKDAVFSSALGDGLKQQIDAGALVADHRLGSRPDALDRTELAAAIADLKDKRPNVLVLGLGGVRLAQLLKDLVAADATPALFLTGQIASLPPEIIASYPNAIYQLAWDRLPEAYNDRLRKLIATGAAETWTFEGKKNATAPGWASGECKPRIEGLPPDPLQNANLRAIQLGTQHADMVALVAASLRAAGPISDMAALRKEVARSIAASYVSGRGTFKGPFDNWSFHGKSRAAQRTPFIVMLPQGLGRTQLAPSQFVRTKDGSLRRIDTLYIDIDMIRTYRVEDSEKTFYAEFYLSMRNNAGASIERIDFTNAYLDPRTNGRQITIETLHAGGRSDAYPEGMRIYKVSGRFVFEPDLANYPFDTQRFSIDIQPKKGDAPFIIQPPPNHLRDSQVSTDGWSAKTQYVGYDEDFVPIVDAYTHEPSVVPFYKASFVWLMSRQTTDYYLRVVVPLAFILIVAYLSIFIPQSHFEAIVTIQVTALLSAVALYLSLPKLDADTATLSDRLFVFNYLLVSVMIGISILRVNRAVSHWPWLKRVLGTAHIVGIPLVVAAIAWYIYGLSQIDP